MPTPNWRQDNVCVIAARYGPDSMILDCYALDDLVGDEAAAIRQHLAQCQSCWQQVAATKASLVDTQELAADLSDIALAVKLLPRCAYARQRFPGTYQPEVVYVAHVLALPLDADEDAWVTAHAPACPSARTFSICCKTPHLSASGDSATRDPRDPAFIFRHSLTAARPCVRTAHAPQAKGGSVMGIDRLGTLDWVDSSICKRSIPRTEVARAESGARTITIGTCCQDRCLGCKQEKPPEQRRFLYCAMCRDVD